jgi:signal transduction histidine kinase
MTLSNPYEDEANRGEKVAMRFRWILVALVFILIVLVLLNGDYKEAVVSSIIALTFGVYYLFLILLFSQGKVYYWVRYMSVSLDIGLLSVHIYSLAVFISPFAVATASTILLYPVLMFLSVLRYDKKLILYTIIFTLTCFNLVYILQYPSLDLELMTRMISTDPFGQVYKSVYLLLFGVLLLHIPDLVNRLVKRHTEIAEEKKQSELQLALEMKENEYIEEKLAYARLINEQLKDKNEQIAVQIDKLKELNTTKDRLFSIIGHDLKNPFTVLISISQMIQDQLDHLDNEDLKQSLNIINNASTQGYALLDNLLDWARSQTGEIKFDPVTIVLNEFVRDVLVQTGPISEKKQVRIRNTVGTNIVVTADRNMLYTILRNLISNAIKFSVPGGEVLIDAIFDETVERTMVTVTDRGVGIPNENLANLFNITKHQSTKGTLQESGTGLGLLICKEFAERHNGSLDVISTEGEGTQICFTLQSAGR